MRDIDKEIEEVLRVLSVDDTGVNLLAVLQAKERLDDLYRQKFDSIGR